MKDLLLYIILFASATAAMADAVGTWKLYPSYTNITEVQYSKADSSEVFVLAGGNLFAYYNSDHTFAEFMIEGASSATGLSFDILSSRDISHIAWCQTVRKLVIVYSDGMIDVLNAKDRNNPTVGSIVGLKNTTLFTDKSVEKIYVKGQYAYLQTSAHILKIDVKDEYIVQIYNTTDITLVDDLTSDNLAEPVTLKYKYGNTTIPDGPKYIQNYYIKYGGGKLYSVRGVYEDWRDITTEYEGSLQIFDTQLHTWTVADNTLAAENSKRCIDYLSIDIDPTKANHVAVGSRSGLYEYQDGKMSSYIDCNSGTPITGFGSPNWTIIQDAKYDERGNLWIFNQGNRKVICYSADHQWQVFDHDADMPITPRFRKAFTDSRGYMWLANDFWNPTSYGFYIPSTDKLRHASNFINQDGAKLTSNNLITKGVAEDANNNIWYCTDNGVFYLTPSTISMMSQGVTGDNIAIEQPKVNREDGSGLADYLLSNVGAYDIFIDSTNRKWFATYYNGLYCISSDNQSQEYHFTTDNSPLPTNEIRSLSMDEENGVLYIGTMKGVCSFQTDVTSTSGDLSSDNVYAYPNPVTPEYTGYITIMGLTNGCSLKITNTAGQIVHSGICNGGSYKWNGCDSTGTKVASGVYMVLVSNAEGDDGCVTKIAIIK